MSEIVVVGSINMDLTMSTNIFPNPGETVLGDSFHTDLGGKGANQAIAAANLGADVSMIGSVGNDLYGKLSCDNLANSGVSVTDIIVQENTPSGTAMIILCDKDNRIIVNSGANALLAPEHLRSKADLLTNAKVVLSQLETPLETVQEAFLIAKENHCITVLNPSPICELPTALLELTDVLILNEHEAATLINKPIERLKDAEDAIPLLLKLGVQKVILTLGALGCVYTLEGKTYYHPARKVSAVDTTGAGDSFAGAIVYSLARNVPMAQAIMLATVVSSVTVTRKGTSSSFPRLPEIENILQKEGIFLALS